MASAIEWRHQLIVGCVVLIAGPPALAIYARDTIKEIAPVASAPISAATLTSLEIDLPATPETTVVELDEGSADHLTDDPDEPDPE